MTPAEIKKELWHGAAQRAVAAAAGLKLYMVHQIVRGTLFPDASWPDGSLGRMSSNHLRELTSKKRRSAAMIRWNKKKGPNKIKIA